MLAFYTIISYNIIWKGKIKMYAIIFLIFFVISIVLMFSGNFGLGFFLMILSCIVFLILYSNKEKEKNIKERERISNMNSEERKRYYDDQTIDYTILVGAESKKSVGSAVTRGAIGGAILGPVGLAAGALSAKNNNKTTFTVVYKSGRTEVVTVDNDSDEFKKYARYLR